MNRGVFKIMRKVIIILMQILIPGMILAQQMPVTENYYMDKYALSSSWAGHADSGAMFFSFRSDWTGIRGGPKTLRLSYSDIFMKNAAFGGKMIYDNAGIFRQLYILGTYSYNIKVAEGHRILLALSAGLYRNKINFTEYYNDPGYNIDPVMIRQDVPSKLKFMSDFSALYLFRRVEAGIMFANINFGDAKYKDIDVTYKPFANYQVHASWSADLGDRWELNPLLLIRGGRFIKNQVGISLMARYQHNIWVSISFRDPAIWGFGFGAELTRGVRLSYNFNVSTSVAAEIYNNHEIALGLNIKDLINRSGKEGLNH